MQRYAVIYRPGEMWQKGRRWQDQDLHEHGAFMEGLLKEARHGHFTQVPDLRCLRS